MLTFEWIALQAVPSFRDRIRSRRAASGMLHGASTRAVRRVVRTCCARVATCRAVGPADALPADALCCRRLGLATVTAMVFTAHAPEFALHLRSRLSRTRTCDNGSSVVVCPGSRARCYRRCVALRLRSPVHVHTLGGGPCCRQRTEERVALVDGDDESFADERTWERRTTKASRQVI